MRWIVVGMMFVYCFWKGEEEKNLGCSWVSDEGDVEYYEEEEGRRWRKGNITSCCWITVR